MLALFARADQGVASDDVRLDAPAAHGVVAKQFVLGAGKHGGDETESHVWRGLFAPVFGIRVEKPRGVRVGTRYGRSYR